MDTFYQEMPLEGAIDIEQLARLMFEVRSARQILLDSNAAADEADLLARIGRGEVAEHPAYEQYLSARILATVLGDVRGELSRHLDTLAGKQTAPVAAGNCHLELAAEIGDQFGTRLEGPVETKLDALLLRLDNGVSLELRFAAADAYAISWLWGEAGLRIDTAPLAGAVAPGASHLHAADGSRRADPLTQCGASPWANLRAVISHLLEDPLLARFDDSPTITEAWS